MGWGEPHIDLTSAVGGIVSLPISVLLRVRASIS
jgi:hypothetical protein